MQKINLFSKNFVTLYLLYIASIFLVGIMIWSAFSIASLGTSANIQSALFTTLGLKFPDSFVAGGADLKFIFINVLVVILTIFLLIINIYFNALVTAKLISPKVDVFTSKGGVLSTKWSNNNPHILVRMVNFNTSDLVDVKIKAIITIEETIQFENGEFRSFVNYFPVTNLDPEFILILAKGAPWSIAVPANLTLSNSINNKGAVPVN